MNLLPDEGVFDLDSDVCEESKLNYNRKCKLYQFLIDGS
jgi:hypothetical protein